MRIKRLACIGWLAASVGMFCAGPARGEDRIVAFGGGSSPANNQVSLEKNMRYFEQVLGDLGLGKVRRDTFFGDGGTNNHSVLYEVEASPREDFLGGLSYILSYDSALNERYRPTELKGLSGATTHDAMVKWFDESGRTLRASDRLLFYFTGHGGEEREGGPGGGRGAGPRNTTMDMWGSPPMTMREFARELDKVDAGAEVVMIMVQCHSAGFANVIYNDGDFRKGISEHRRVGFFATTAARLSAGCTPEMREENYQDFSTHFFAALSGRTRTGKAVEKPDYDKKGFTSYADAFTYVLLNDETIDIPMMTSDQLLRDFSRYRGQDGAGELLARNAAYSVVLQGATAAQQAALEGLSKQLGLGGEQRIADARAMARDLQQQRTRLERDRREVEARVEQLRGRLRDALLQRYPELGIPWHPETTKMLAGGGLDELRKFVESQGEWKSYSDADARVDELDAKDEELEDKWCRVQRFLERAQSVILALNLPRVADKGVVAAYVRMTAMERGRLERQALPE